jgi:hypothetical protein
LLLTKTLIQQQQQQQLTLPPLAVPLPLAPTMPQQLQQQSGLVPSPLTLQQPQQQSGLVPSPLTLQQPQQQPDLVSSPLTLQRPQQQPGLVMPPLSSLMTRSHLLHSSASAARHSSRMTSAASSLMVRHM